MTDGASVVGTTPQSRHPGHQMRKFLTKYSAAGTFETVDHFCRTSSRVRCDKQMYVVWHHFHSLDEHAVLLCRGIQNVLEPLFASSSNRQPSPSDGKVILSYRRNERKRGKAGFAPRLTRAKNAWKV